MASDPLLITPTRILEVVAEIARCMHASLDLEDLLGRSVQIVRELLQTDRVVIYQFLPAGDGLVSTESVRDPWRPIRGDCIHDPCFENNRSISSQREYVSAVADIHAANLHECYVQLLISMQVAAKLVVPVFCQEKLWGLLIAHHCQGPRSWRTLDVELMKQMALQLAQAVEVMELRSQLRQQQVLEQKLEQQARMLRTYEQRCQQQAAILNQTIAALTQMRVYGDGSYRVDYRSWGCERIFGYSAQELMQNPDLWRSRIWPEDWQAIVMPAFSHMTASGQRTLEYRFQCPDGRMRWISETLVFCFDSQAAGWQVTMVGIDITHRKQIEAELRRSRALFYLVANNINQFLFVRDAFSGQMLYASPAYEKIWQRSLESLYSDQESWLRAILPEDLPEVRRTIDVQMQGQSVTREYRIRRPNGEIRWIYAQVFPIFNVDGEMTRYVGWAEDCTERKHLQQQAEATQQQLNTILDTAIAAVRYFRVYADGRYEMEYCSKGSAAVFGLTVAEMQRVPELWCSCIAAEDAQRLSGDVLTSILAEEKVTFKYRFYPPNGSLRWVEDILTPSRDDLANCWRVTALAVDITHQKQAESALQQANQELTRLSMTDALTQLANRRWFDTYLQQAWQQLLRQRAPLSLILCDVDFFKLYNDTYGHRHGDTCLIQIAAAIQQSVKRPEDLAARYGGEEFAIVLPHTDGRGGLKVIERIRQQIHQLAIAHAASPIEARITLSFGIATLVPSSDTKSETLVQNADQALYQAKKLGRNCYHQFPPSPSELP